MKKIIDWFDAFDKLKKRTKEWFTLKDTQVAMAILLFLIVVYSIFYSIHDVSLPWYWSSIFVGILGIGGLLREYLNTERDKSSRTLEALGTMARQLSRARLVPRVQLRLHYTLWACSLLLIGYLTVQLSRAENVREKAFEKGEEQVFLELKGYFEKHPEHFQTYLEWTKEKDGFPNR